MANENAKETDFMSLTEIEVSATYGFTEPKTKIVLFCKLALEIDDLSARQAFYTKPEADRAAGQHAYNVDLLSRVMVRKPEGLPGFDDYMENHFTEPEFGTKYQVAFVQYLSPATPMMIKIVGDLVDRYNAIIQPDEFFR